MQAEQMNPAQGMPSQGMPVPEGKPGPQKSPSDLIASGMDSLMQFGDVMSKSKALPPEVIQKYATIVAALQQFVQNELGAQADEQPSAPPQQASQGMPPQMAGNPNAKPAQF